MCNHSELNVLLQNEVGAKKRSFEVYQAYIKDLLAENMSIISSIVELEKKTVSVNN